MQEHDRFCVGMWRRWLPGERSRRALDHQRKKVQAHPEAAAVVQRFRRDGQQPSRGARGAPAEPRRRYRRAGRTAVPALFGASAGEEDGEWTRKVSNVLRDDYTAFNHAAISYAALCEMGFRLYNPPLREIALRHLRAYAEATQQINQLIASVVAWGCSSKGWSAVAYAPCAAWVPAAAWRPAPGR